jgi:RNA polymerase sigma-70 factor, ECF subfamily
MAGQPLNRPGDPVPASDPAEVALVAGCVANDPAALRAFEAAYFERAVAALARMGLSGDEIDDVLQVVRLRLFVPDESGACRLERYAGRGDLRALVRVIATRIAIDLRRAERRLVHRDDDELIDLPAADPDPRLSAIRRECVEHFAPAFRAASGRLERRERNLLRLHLVDGVSLEALARSYQVHRTTVVRWLVKARAQLLDALVAELTARTGMDPGGAADWVAEVRSQIDLSLSRILATVTRTR